jgi:tetratricopeptide (TPR) repeat protein
MQKIQNSPIKFVALLAVFVWLTACDTMQSTKTDTGNVSSPPQTENSTAVSDTPVYDTPETLPADNKSNAGNGLNENTMFYLLAAEFAGNQGDLEQSVKYYEKASSELDDARVAARAAYIALYNEDYDAALEALDRWKSLEPDATDLERMYAEVYLKSGEPEKAVPHVEKMLEQTPGNSVDKTMALKQMLATDASTEDGYTVLKAINADDDKKNPHLLVLESRYAAQLGKYDEALAKLDQALELAPDMYEVLIIKARVLTVAGRKDEATQVIKQVLDKLPDNDVVRQQYARMLIEQGDVEGALEQYRVLYKKSPDDPDIGLSYALLNIELGKLDDAYAALTHLIEIDKNVPISNYYLGRIEQNRNNDKKAISYFLKVKEGPYVFDAQLRIGVLLAVLGKPDEGLRKLESLGEQQTDWSKRVKTYLAQGEILRSEKRYKEGVEMYSRALQQNRDDTTLLYARGLMAEKDDRLDMTESDLMKVIAREPDNADALNALGYTLADRTNRYTEALGYIERAAKLVPDDPAILDSLGWVSYRLGKLEDARKWLEKAFNKLVDAEIAAHYGEVLWKMNQKDQARKVWKMGKEQNANDPVLVETLKRIKPW